MSSIDNKLLKRSVPGKFDAQAMLDSSHETLMQSYEKQIDQYTKANMTHKDIKKRSVRNYRYTDEQIISFRSACLAKNEINCTKISINAIGKQHGIAPPYAHQIYKNYLKRPDCLPDPELVEKFKAKYAESMAHIKVIQANKAMSELDPEKQRILKRSKRALQWDELWKHFKRNFNKHPHDGITALVMLREMCINEVITREDAVLGVNLIFEKIVMFKELMPAEED